MDQERNKRREQNRYFTVVMSSFLLAKRDASSIFKVVGKYKRFILI
jgi:hypothetical protein